MPVTRDGNSSLSTHLIAYVVVIGAKAADGRASLNRTKNHIPKWNRGTGVDPQDNEEDMFRPSLSYISAIADLV